MARGGKVEGLGTVTANLNAKVNEIEGRSFTGLLKGGFLVQRVASARAPKDIGNLAGGSYTQKDPGGRLAVEVGFEAAYAPFVHENMEQTLKGQPRRSGSGHGVYWETGQPKFLESALHDKERDVLRLIRNDAKKATR